MKHLFPMHVACAVCLAAVLMAGCAAGTLSQGYLPAEGPEPTSTAAVSATGSTASDYKLTPEEAELDCKRLAGKVQLRILEVRSGLTPEESSTIARSLQATNAVFGGSTAGLNAKGERARQVAQLQAYNEQLASKNCRSFDIAKALASDETVPSPTVPPRTAAR